MAHKKAAEVQQQQPEPTAEPTPVFLPADMPEAPSADLAIPRFIKTYYVRGGAPKFWKHRYEISDPPTSGFSHAVVIDGIKRSTILCPYTLETYQVSNNCGELAESVDVSISFRRLGEIITNTWEQCVKLGFQRQYQIAALVLAAIGQPVPKILPPPVAAGEHGSRGGKDFDPKALKPVNPESKRGKVAAFFNQPEPQSIHEAMARLELTRSGVLSHLFCLNRDHGIGYELGNDCASLVVPEGFDLFAYVAPERAERAPPKTNEDGSLHVPKKRTSGKPVNEDALRPIPEPGQRATVARLFYAGFYSVDKAMETLKLSRSAVLSHLFTINQQNGLGYELSEDGKQARLIVPKGHRAFASKADLKKEKGNA